ncbi:sensor histidine kinase [Lysobacter sp. HA18]
MPTVTRRSLSLMVTGLVFFGALAVISTRTLQSVRASTAIRAQAQDSMLVNSRLLASLVDVETGQRGFSLTGESAFLEPLDSGLQRQSALVDNLTKQTATMPAVAAHVQHMRPLIHDKLALVQKSIDWRRSGHQTVNLQFAERGKVAMDRIRRESGEIDVLLRAESLQRERQLATVMSRAASIEIGLGVVGTLAILAGLALLVRERKRRLEAEFELYSANHHLEARVMERTHELEQARAQLESFATRLDHSIEAERRRLAREVHDQLGQVFTALKLTCSHQAKRYSMSESDLRLVMSTLDEGVAIARRISSELRPPLLDDLGLAAALELRGERFEQESGIACDVAVADGELVPAAHRIQLFRIVQEALTNVARHSGAAHVWIGGGRTDGGYTFFVEDDGHGQVAPRRGSAGIASMSERAALAGGRLQMERGTHGGLRVAVLIPSEALS